MSDKELATKLKDWFKKSNKNYQNFWHKNPVASLIKNELKILGNWRNKKPGQRELNEKLDF